MNMFRIMLAVVAMVLLAACTAAKVASTAIASFSPTSGTANGGTVVTITLKEPVPSNNVSACGIAPGTIYGLPAVAGNLTKVNGTTVECVLPAIQTVGSVLIRVQAQGQWLQSEGLFAYVQPLDVTLGRSLYNTGGPAAAAKGGHAVADERGEALLLLSPIAGGCEGEASVELREEESGRVLALQGGLPTDGTTKVSVPFQLATLSCISDGRDPWLTEADKQAGLVCNTSIVVMATWDQTNTVVKRSVRLLAGPWGASTTVVDYRSGALLVEDGRKFISTGFFYSLHNNKSATYAPTAFRVQARYGDTMVMPYAVDMASTENLADAAEYLADEAYNNGMRIVVDLSSTLYTIMEGNATAGWSIIDQAIHQLRSHPAVLGWYVNDDTIGRPFSICRRLYLLVRSLDPWHPTFAAIAGSGNAWQYHSDSPDPTGGAAGMTYDVGGYEMYIDNDPAFEISTIPLVWPLVWSPQWITASGRGSALASEQVHRLQGILSAMFHAKGSWMYNYWPFSEASWPFAVQASRWANGAIGEFAPQLLSSLLDPRAGVSVYSPTGGVLAVELTDEDQCTLLLVANTGRQPTPFGLVSPAASRLMASEEEEEGGGESEGLQGLRGHAAVVDATGVATRQDKTLLAPVLFERRRASFTAGGILNETLGGFGHRAIRINCSAEGGGGGPGKGYGDDDWAHDDVMTDDGGGHTTANRLYNPSFEDFETPAQPAGAFFNRLCQDGVHVCPPGVGLEPQAHRVLDSLVSHSLGHSMRVSGHVDRSDGTPRTYIEGIRLSDSYDKNPGGRAIDLPKGLTVTLGAWVRPGISAPDWPGMSVMYIAQASRDPVCQWDLREMGLAPFQWHHLTCRHTPNATAVGLMLAFEGSGTIWIDDISLEFDGEWDA